MRMKKFLIPILLVFLVSACKKVDKLTQFIIEMKSEATIPSSIGVNVPLDVNSPDVETNSESTFEVNDTRKDKIEQIILQKLHLTISSPTGQDFSFLKSISIYISADGLDEVQIAYKDPVPTSVTDVLEMDVTSADLQAYVKKDQFDLRLNTITDEVITQNYTIEIYQQYFVDAVVLGQ